MFQQRQLRLPSALGSLRRRRLADLFLPVSEGTPPALSGCWSVYIAKTKFSTMSYLSIPEKKAAGAFLGAFLKSFEDPWGTAHPQPSPTPFAQDVCVFVSS